MISCIKKYLLALLIMTFSVGVVGQSRFVNDSMAMKLATADDSTRLDILLRLSWSLRNTAPDEALVYGLEAMQLSAKLNDMVRNVRAHSFVGTIYRVLGDYNKATDVFFTGLEFAREHNIPEGEGYALINIGNLYIYLEYYTSALDYLTQAEKIAKKLGNENMEAYALLNKGRAAMFLGMSEQSLENIGQSLEIRKKMENKEGQAVCNKYLGDVYFQMGQKEKAIFHFEEARRLCPPDTQKDLLGNIYIQLALLNLGEGDIPRAMDNAERALAIGQEINSRMIIRDALRIHADINLMRSRYQKAATELKTIISYNDTLFNQQLSEKISNLEVQYERQKRQIEIDLLNKDKEIKDLRLARTRTIMLGLVIVLIVVVTAGFFLLFLNRKVKRQNVILRRQKSELAKMNMAKDKMFMVIGHDLRGPIGSCKALLELLLEDAELVDNKDQIETLNVLIQSAQSVGSLLENLLLWAKNQEGEVRYEPVSLSLNALLDQTLGIYRTLLAQKNISIHSGLRKEYLLMADQNMLSTILRNLVSNAIKFSHQGGQVDISVKEQGDDYLTISIQDRGVGFDEKVAEQIFQKNNFLSTIGTRNEVGSGLGLNICKDFVEKHNGKIWAESQPGKGACFYFTMPLAPIRWN